MNPRKTNRLAADTDIRMSLLGTKAELCHRGAKCVRHCKADEALYTDTGGKHTRCHEGKCWPNG